MSNPDANYPHLSELAVFRAKVAASLKAGRESAVKHAHEPQWLAAYYPALLEQLEKLVRDYRSSSEIMQEVLRDDPRG